MSLATGQVAWGSTREFGLPFAFVPSLQTLLLEAIGAATSDALTLDFSDATLALREMVRGLIARLPHVAVALGVFLIFAGVARGVRGAVRRLNERRFRHQNLAIVLGRLAHGAIIFVGLLVALVIAVPGFTPGQLVSVLGIGSVAIGFAFRDILQNFLAGILLLLSEPFRVGDIINTGPYEGTVEDVQTRATTIKTFDGRRVVIPNSDLFTNAVTVVTVGDKRRMQTEIGIGVGDDIERARALMIEAMNACPEVLKEPTPEAFVVGISQGKVEVRIRFWIDPPSERDVLLIQGQVLTAVKSALDAGIT